uniref:hypothetical protein n=1 Tax=Streptomyces sp. NBC_01001 TaxID=2903713 RepID=UPI002F90D8B5
MREAFGVNDPYLDRVFLDPEVPPAPDGVPPEVLGAYALAAGMPAVDEARSFALLGVAGEDLVCLDEFFESKTKAMPLGVGAPTYAERIAMLAALADMVAVWQADLLAAIQEWLPPSYEFTDHTPPLACSPCGVIRMASPEVPRGPELDLHLDTCKPFWALAA